jgi:uncharacterized protein YlxW (UPF0749 family)
VEQSRNRVEQSRNRVEQIRNREEQIRNRVEQIRNRVEQIRNRVEQIRNRVEQIRNGVEQIRRHCVSGVDPLSYSRGTCGGGESLHMVLRSRGVKLTTRLHAVLVNQYSTVP